MLSRLRSNLALRTRTRRILDKRRNNSIYKKYKHATMIDAETFKANTALAIELLKAPNLSMGAVIECGTWSSLAWPLASVTNSIA